MRLRILLIIFLLCSACSASEGQSANDPTSDTTFVFIDHRSDDYNFYLFVSDIAEDFSIRLEQDFDSNCEFNSPALQSARIVGSLEESELDALSELLSQEKLRIYKGDEVDWDDYAVRDSEGEVCTRRDLIVADIRGSSFALSESAPDLSVETQDFIREVRALRHELFLRGEPFNESDEIALQNWSGPTP